MFSLDDFTDDCEPFFESEEDDFSSSGKHVDMLGFKNLVYIHVHVQGLISFIGC